MLSKVAPSLQRLFVDKSWDNWGPVYPSWRQMPLLTELICAHTDFMEKMTRDGLPNGTTNLRRLALSYSTIDMDFMHALSDFPLLENLVLVLPDPLCCDAAPSMALPPALRTVAIFIDPYARLIEQRLAWHRLFHTLASWRGVAIGVAFYDTPRKTTSYSHIPDWLSWKSENGLLWEMEGEISTLQALR